MKNRAAEVHIKIDVFGIESATEMLDTLLSRHSFKEWYLLFISLIDILLLRPVSFSKLKFLEKVES